MLHLRILGGLSLENDGSAISGPAAQRKRLALLAMLACSGDRGVSRDRLLAVFWPESDKERARGALKQSLYALRRELGDFEIVLGSTQLRLNEAVIQCDAQLFQKAWAVRDHERVVQLYSGALLDGVHIDEAPEFERWLESERDRLTALYRSALQTLAEKSGERGDHAAAVEWWKRLAKVDPLSTSTAISLMNALVAGGDRPAALQHARTHELLLRRELDVAPDPALSALEASIRSSYEPAKREATSPRPSSRLAASPSDAGSDAVLTGSSRKVSKIRRLSTAGALVVLALAGVFWRPRPAAEFDPLSIVILPPVDHSEHSSFRYLIETVHGEIISELRSATALRIRSEYSARQYRDSTKPLGEIARELGVATVVHGSARASKESVHVRFEIIQTRPVEKQLAVVQESADRTSLSTLAARVANGILAHVLPDAAPAATFARDSIAGVRRVDAEAYEAYLSGKYAWSRMMADSMYKAIELYRFAIARDSHFVRAYIGLAEAYAFLPYYAPVEARNAFPVAKQAAQKALALDSTSGAAHAILGWATLVYDLDWRRAEVHMRRAIELSPRYATGRMLYSWLLTATHRFDEAIAQDLEASADDPLSPRIKAHLGIVYEFSRQFDRAIAQFRSTLARDSGFVRARTDLGVTYLHMGDARLAIEHLSKAVAASPAGAGSVNPRTYLAEAMALAGNRDSARTLLEALLAERRVRYIPPLNIARILVALGDVNEAFPWFDRAFDEHDPDLILLDVSPSYDAVREDARFRALLRRGGFRRGTP